ncbi:polyphosphate polymerase domain-containing protein [Oscillibacter sp.]|uniref:polyphosphate polymerase domain-containing protein n=1 Tax=Oscillibacter sp. TaxID=1945593 RepID=UPI002D7FE6E7|nr:polyphosphate polymerase domain-containing protein [Oscillibacter sp.]
MKPRHEWKHEITAADRLVLASRLSAIARRDVHGQNGRYEIRSLYFDDPQDTALREKIDGVAKREKFRIRCYGGDASYICLEKKSKWDGLCGKRSVLLSAQEVQSLLDGELDWMPDSGRPLVQELYWKMKTNVLRPRTIVDYTRDAFVFSAGNVRVTLDYNIRTGLGSTDFLNSAAVTIPAGAAPSILEVKWDEFLPDIIREAVQLPGRHTSAFSKYAACRIYG